MGATSILEMASSLQPGLTKHFPMKNERCPKAASSPANEKWESNSVASSNSSHFDFSSNTDEVFSHIGIRESTPNDFVAL